MKEIRYFQDSNGKVPYLKWYKKLKDRKAKLLIQRRLDSVEVGNLGKVNSCGGGVHELKLDFGPGYRIYFGNDGDRIVILLCGGDKTSQERDIEKSLQYWMEYKEAKDG